ncbi:MAG: S41 family peptidase [Alphaproteobacteria bacterium]|nr:S41 family peptidase [Alphaproteobacteria bacterium]
MYKFIFFLLLALTAAEPVKADYDTIASVYRKVHEENPQHLSYARITEEALKGLQNMDDKLKFGTQAGRVTIYYDGKMVRSFHKPEQEKAEGWADLTEEVLAAAKKVSGQVSLHDFEAADEMLSALVSALKDGSKYYKAMDLAGEEVFVPRKAFSTYQREGILYVKIKVFDRDSAEKLHQAIEKEMDVAGMVLDLRGSSGGSLAAMVNIADMFLDDGIIVSVKSADGQEENFYNANAGGEWDKKPLAVLVDADTASSAEALALSLQEQGRAKLVGTRTYGKSTVQELTDLDNGSRLSLTTSKILGPSGAEVSENGLVPDICTAYMGEVQKPEFVAQKAKAADCPRQKREKQEFDILTARVLIHKKL